MVEQRSIVAATVPTGPEADLAAEIAAEQDHYAEALLRFRGDVRMMEQVLATMIERRVPRGAVHLGLMLDQYLEGRELRKARAVIAQLDEAGIALDAVRRYAVALATAAAPLPLSVARGSAPPESSDELRPLPVATAQRLVAIERAFSVQDYPRVLELADSLIGLPDLEGRPEQIGRAHV